jgi:hypothetical protein
MLRWVVRRWRSLPSGDLHSMWWRRSSMLSGKHVQWLFTHVPDRSLPRVYFAFFERRSSHMRDEDRWVDMVLGVQQLG